MKNEDASASSFFIVLRNAEAFPGRIALRLASGSLSVGGVARYNGFDFTSPSADGETLRGFCGVNISGRISGFCGKIS